MICRLGPAINNTAGLSYGNTSTFTNANAITFIAGTNRIGDTVFLDNGTGFGNGVTTGDGSGRVNTSRGTVQKSAFGDAQPVAVAQIRPKPTDDAAAKMVPAEVISKPTPAYTPEARNLRIEGEVVLEVVFEASGKLRIVRVVQGLGHGLDESAVHAAEQIRFKPAKRDGQPSDYTALVHIVFQLA